MKLLNIITPCTRPENLYKIAESINIPKENYRWIVVYDSNEVPKNSPEECETYAIKVQRSAVGNGQRNFALDILKEGHIYFNDDDTTLHHDLWETIKDLTKDFISFQQVCKNGSLRLKGDVIKLNNIDSHNFIVSVECIGATRWVIDKYYSDGIFAEECYKKAKTKIYIPKVLSIYNSLR